MPLNSTATTNSCRHHRIRNLRSIPEENQYSKRLEPFQKISYPHELAVPDTAETIAAPLLAKISAALKIPVEAIQNFDEEQAVNVIASTFNDNAQVGAVINNYNPVDAVLKLHE